MLLLTRFKIKKKETRYKVVRDTYLTFGETEYAGQLGFTADGDVAAVVELLLQLEPLVVGVDNPVFVLGSRFACCKYIIRV